MIDFTKLKPRSNGPMLTPILPEDGLFLFDPGIVYQSDLWETPPRLTRKFVRCFQATWQQLPETDRLTLKEFWKPRTSNIDQPSPQIAINLESAHVGTYGAYCHLGMTIVFNVRSLDWSTPTQLKNLIAHELGHAISYPHGWYSQHDCSIVHGESECVACECRAYSYMAAWGFDPFMGMLPKRKELRKRFDAHRKT